MRLSIAFLFIFSTKIWAQGSNEINFLHSKDQDLGKILNIAKSKNKTIFVDVYTVWCGPCKVLDQQTFTNLDVIKRFNSDFICYKVNAEDANGQKIAAKYRVESYPTLLFLNEKGEVLNLMEGVFAPKALLEIAKDMKK